MAETLEVDDCSFSMDFREKSYRTYGVHGHATAKTIVRNCRFKGPRLRSILLFDGLAPDARKDQNLILEDCVMESDLGIILWTRFPEKSTCRIQAQRVVANLTHLIAYDRRYPVYQSEFTFSDSLLNYRSALIYAPKLENSLSIKDISWTGERNSYGVGQYFFYTKDKFHRYRTLEAFRNSPVKVMDTKAQILPLFPSIEITPSALPEKLESPALETLQRLWPIP